MWKEVDIIKTDRVRASDIGGDFNNKIFCVEGTISINNMG
jgi:hypothetical protein